MAQLAAAVRNARLHEERLELEASAAAAEAVAREREHAAQVLEAVGDGILFVSAEGVIGFWNRAAESITGLTREAVHGRTPAELGVDWTALASRVRPAEEHRRPRAVTLPVQVGTRELWLSFLGVRIRDGVVYTFRDTTAERQLEESKHEFIATVSHELRTPMTGVLGAARTLLRDDLELSPESTRELLEMIAAQAQRLSDVTDGLLLADRLERDEVAVEARRVDVDRVVRETVAALEPTLPPSVRLDQIGRAHV